MTRERERDLNSFIFLIVLGAEIHFGSNRAESLAMTCLMCEYSLHNCRRLVTGFRILESETRT